MAHSRTALAAVTLLVGLAMATACSSPAPAAAPAAGAASSPRAPEDRDAGAACDALTDFDSSTVGYPGSDPDAPPPSADDLMQWAATAIEPFNDLADNLPTDLDAPVATLRDAVQGTQQGKAIKTDDPAITAASDAVDRWGRDNCGFTKLDVTGTGTALTGVPATLASGSTTVTFTNSAPAGQAGFVLLLAKVKDGAEYSLDSIRNGSVDFSTVADVVAAAQPSAQIPTAVTNVDLDSGRYLVVSPVGSPPKFTTVMATELDVS